MAKSKVSDIEAALIKKYGNVAISASTLHESEDDIIHTTLGLDIALNGGIPPGSLVSIAGNTGSGKTSLCLTILANAQAMGKKCYYIDLEARLRTSLMDCIEGLDQGELTVIKSSMDKILTAQDVLNIAEGLMKDSPGCVIILDSVAALFTEESYSGEIGASKKMAAVPSLMYEFCRRIVQIGSITKSTFIAITHLQANPSPYGGPTEYGGNAMKFFGAVRLICNSSREFPDSGPKVGRNSEFKIPKSALGPPGSATVIIRYGAGCDKYLDLIENAELMGLVEKTGAWYKVNVGNKDFDALKLQGKDNLATELKGNKELFTLMDGMVRELAFGKKK